MAIIKFPEKPNRYGITPSIAQELIEMGYDPNNPFDLQKWRLDYLEGIEQVKTPSDNGKNIKVKAKKFRKTLIDQGLRRRPGRH